LATSNHPQVGLVVIDQLKQRPAGGLGQPEGPVRDDSADAAWPG
jgi:hypothetical protein